MRIDKLLSSLHYGSRNDIKKMAKDGLIIINDRKEKDASMDVDPNNDTIIINGETLFYKEHLYVMMNKPKDVVSSSTDPYHSTYLDFLPESYHRFDLQVCGRLDVDTTGLLLLTNDGDYLHKVISPKKDVFKTYSVTLDKPIENVEPLTKGVTIKDGQERPYTTKPAIVYDMNGNFCRIKISEGKFHQVKRMFEAIGYTVVQLKREAIGSLNLDESMIEGDVRLLSNEEKELVFIHED